MKELLVGMSPLLGGMALFVYGMNGMSEGLRKAAGERLRYVLGAVTRNTLFGVATGAVTTAVLQSSSATICMAVSFTSAGLIGLPQAIAIIFGANIGTTMTAQLLAFEIGEYVWLVLVAGFILLFFGEGEAVKNTGQIFFSFGLLFVGIQTMEQVVLPLASGPVFTELMGMVAEHPVLGILVGAGMTMIVQSSSATIAVLQSFSSTSVPGTSASVMGLAGAVPVLLGDNIGTTVTSLLAAAGQTKDAKRAALAHSVFNLAGSVVFLIILRPFVEVVALISPRGPEVEVISRQIANAHTLFNVANTILWLPMIGVMERIVRFLVPGPYQEQKTAVCQLVQIPIKKQKCKEDVS